MALENTIGGKIICQGYIQKAKELAVEHNLVFHLDGARAFNAAIGRQVELASITTQFDSVSLCLSKGLGAPVGSVLVSSRDTIDAAKHWRKMVGGGMRQAGVLAAAGLYAINNNVLSLADDHRRAQRLAEGLAEIEGVVVHGGKAHTNMVYISVEHDQGRDFLDACREQGLLFTGSKLLRLVVHNGIDDAMIERAISVVFETMRA